MRPDETPYAKSWRDTSRRLRYLLGYVRPYRGQAALAVLSTTLSTVCAIAIPFAFKQAIDDGFRQPGVDNSAVYLWVGLALAAGLGVWLLNVVATLTNVFAFGVLNDLRAAVFQHVQRLGLDYFEREKTGRIISRLTNDIDALENVVTDGIYMVFWAPLQFVGIQVVMFLINWRLALAVNAIFPIMLLATVGFRYYSVRAYRKTRERMAMVTARLQEGISGMRAVQAFAAESQIEREFTRTADHYRSANMRTIQLSAGYFPGIELLSVVGTVVVLYYGGLLSLEGAITAGALFAFILYINDFFDPIQQLSQFYNNFLSAMAALDKIMEVMETEPTVATGTAAVRPERLEGAVAFEHVGFRYGGDLPLVLDDVSVAVAPGETIALVGHTGAGKSTFARLLARFADPTAGRILIDGHDLRDLDLEWYRTQLGIVPQEGFLFSTTVADNIRFGRPEATIEEVKQAARAVGADVFVEQLEHGYETQIGERGSALSSGQRQLVAFARALLANPRMLVLDEATSSVDVQTELQLTEALYRLVEGRTAFIVAHRLSTIRGADRILVVDAGRIVEQGTHDELLASGGFYADLYGSWRGSARSIEQICEEVQGC